jgi:predicted DCC family thiol-disulfide oxidoreductase YuxK
MAAYDPEHDHLLLFDGVCHLCDGGMRFIVRHDPQARIAFAPIQSTLGQRLYAEHGLDPAAPNTMLFVTPKGSFQASNAAIELARRLGGAWAWAAVFKVVPRPLRDAAYAFVASNRYRWFGKDDVCIMPTPDLKARLRE